MMNREAAENAPDPGKSRGLQGVGFLEVVIAVLGYLAVSIAAGVTLFALGYDFQAGGAVTILLFTSIAAVAPLAAVGIALLPRVRSFAAIGLKSIPGRWVLIGVGVGLLGFLINRLVVVLYVWISGDAAHAANNTLVFLTIRLASEFGLLDKV